MLAGASAPAVAGGPLTSADQIDQLMRVTRYLKIRGRLSPAMVQRLINEVRDRPVLLPDLPVVAAPPDPRAYYLLATASAGVVGSW